MTNLKTTRANTTDMSSQRKRPANQSRNNSNVAPSTTTPQQKKPASNTNTNKSTHTPNSNDTNNIKTATTQAAKSATAPAPEQHVPLTGFNPAEVDKLLRSGCSPNAERYKPAKPPLQKAGPWGQKPGHTAAGRDFWVELRRQVGQLQKGESASKGG